MKQKVLVVTGASKGIGLSTVQLFQEQGYAVVNLSRSECRQEAVVNIKVDLANTVWPSSVFDTLQGALENATQVCLMHNAATMTKEKVQEVEADDLRRVLELNIVAAARLNRFIIPFMRQGSSIVYIGSTLSHKAVANTYNYVISKHAVVGQMRASCQDLAGSGIHTACVCPGFTATEMLQQHFGQQPELLKQITDTVAMGRLVMPEEVAQTVLFCAQNPAINGAMLDVNLGQIER